jgi:3-phenylpropionate/trans-cinnamate dioxygenase ferredoxin reductase subunit
MRSTAAPRITGSTASTAMGAEALVIVGAGPAGLAAARGYREQGGDAPVTLIGEETVAPYRRPPLSKEFLRGEVALEELALIEAEWFERNGVSLRLDCRVVAIDPDAGRVSFDQGPPMEAGAIVLATGSEPVRDAFPGAGDPGVDTLRSHLDSARLRDRETSEPIVVIGTGFIGCEVAASAAMTGSPVVMLGEEELPQLARLGADAAERIAGWLSDLGVELIMGVEVREVREATTVELADGRTVRGSRVVLGLGARPRVGLARAAGLALRDGAVEVDETMRCPGVEGRVLAVGDIAHAHNCAAGRPLRVEHWGDALEQGEIAGRTLAGEDCRWQSVPGFWSTIGERTLKYAAWGDGYDAQRLELGKDGAFTVWYSRDGGAVGVLTHDRDEDYERGRELIAAGEPAP